MKKKIIIAFVGVMLFTTTFAIATNIETMDSHRKLYEKIPISSDDVPIWEPGHKWIYDVDFAYNIDDDLRLSFELSLNNLNINVVERIGDLYTTEFDDNVICDFSFQKEGLPSISGTFKNTEITGYIIYDTTNLGIREVYAHIDGRISLIGFIPISIYGEVTFTFASSYNILDFPLYVGKNWIIPYSSLSIVGSISLPDIASIIPDFPEEIEINDEYTIFDMDAECVGLDNITVYAGTYNTYNITIDGSTNSFYAPAAGNIIKIALLSSEYEFGFELKSTNYAEGAPNKPDKPSGPTKIESGVEYTYSTSTTDSEGDQIWYWFDWGDGTNSGWLGSYNSGDTCDASHTWTEKGTYIIKVRAKDTDGHESLWSDPLSVSMPKNKVSLQSGSFKAEMGLKDKPPLINLDGRYRDFRNIYLLFGSVSLIENYRTARFQGVFFRNIFIIQTAVKGRIINVVGRFFSYNEEDQIYSGIWRGYLAGVGRTTGWITASFN